MGRDVFDEALTAKASGCWEEHYEIFRAVPYLGTTPLFATLVLGHSCGRQPSPGPGYHVFFLLDMILFGFYNKSKPAIKEKGSVGGLQTGSPCSNLPKNGAGGTVPHGMPYLLPWDAS